MPPALVAYGLAVNAELHRCATKRAALLHSLTVIRGRVALALADCWLVRHDVVWLFVVNALYYTPRATRGFLKNGSTRC